MAPPALRPPPYPLRASATTADTASVIVKPAPVATGIATLTPASCAREPAVHWRDTTRNAPPRGGVIQPISVPPTMTVRKSERPDAPVVAAADMRSPVSA